jgi:OmpA-OmpF porin, OOP family
MNALKYMLTAAAGFALSGCAALTNVHDVNHIRNASAQGGTPFTQALASEYRIQAINEADNEVEWDDAAFFARKGLRAAKGEAVPPADVAAAPAGSWVRHGSLGAVIQIPADRVPDLAAARAKLVAFLDDGGPDRQPALAARAQGLYDCWLEEEWEVDADVECRDEFLTLEPQFRMAQAAATPKPAAPAPRENTFQVFFDFDRSDISEAAARILRQVADSAKQDTVTTIKLTGHTDSSGTEKYNQMLSERRADAVKAELVRDGVPATEITSLGVGESGQLMATQDGVREPQNRRTEILLQ